MSPEEFKSDSVLNDVKPLQLRKFGDTAATRDAIYSNVLKAAQNIEPITNTRHTLSLHNVDYADPPTFSIKKQKEAILAGKSLQRRIRGTWRLTDNTTGEVLDEKHATVAHVPHLTDSGAFILNGTQYGLKNQMRLQPGVYARIKENGEVESHVNIAPGRGASHRYLLSPETGAFKINIGQAKMPLAPILSAMGVTDRQMREHWGPEIAAANVSENDKRTIDKLYAKVVKKGDPDTPTENKAKAVAEAMMAFELDPEVTKRTLGYPHKNLTPEAILDTTKKLLSVSRGEVEPDDRDHLAYQQFHGPEDLMAERFAKDKSFMRQLLWKSSYKSNLQHIQTGALTKQVHHALMHSGLGQVVEGINPAELLDTNVAVTRTGEGGIEDADSIPDSCYDAKTEVFTSLGWIYWPEVNAETKFACLIDGRMEFHKAYCLMENDYNGLMYGARTTAIDYLVTPNHRMWVRKYRCTSSVKRCGLADWGFELAHNTHKKPREFIVSCDAYVGNNTSERMYSYAYYTEQYNGKVYCAQVPGELLLVRRNKKVGMWLGNSRGVSNSSFAYIDPLKTPESGAVGVDTRIASAVLKGNDGRIYAPYTDVKTGRQVYRSPQDVEDKVVAFPNELRKGESHVYAQVKGKTKLVPRETVDYEQPHMEHIFSPLTNMIPMKSGSKGQRVSMGSRYISQSLPLVNREPALVQSAMPGRHGIGDEGYSYEQYYGKHLGAVHADDQQAGTVQKIDKEGITVRYDNGTIKTHEIYDNYPGARKTALHNEPIVQVGQRIQPGEILAPSNFTDKHGTTSLGLNANIAFIPYKGATYEDSNVISESMAKRLTSEHLYKHNQEWTDKHKKGLKNYVGLFPATYDKKILANFDEHGVAKPGTVLKYGDPFILAPEEREITHSKVHKSKSRSYADKSQVWEHMNEGTVTDVYHGPKDTAVTVKSLSPMQIGDKVSSRFGGKGIVGMIIPDHEMPHDDEGKPYDALFTPLGTLSRINPGQHAETVLGKVAAKTGKPYKIEDFSNIEDLRQFAADEAKKHGVSEKETVTDPSTGRKIPNVLTGVQYLLKLHHQAEGKAQGRSIGGYTAEEIPARGGDASAKKIGLLETYALLSHGAAHVARDAKLIRGQENNDLWQAYMSGYRMPEPRVPLIYQKYLDSLRAIGVNPVRQGTQIHLMALDRKTLDNMVGDRNIENADTVDWKEGLKPIKGGLFDPALSGGHGGNRWSAIKLHEPMPSPAFEEPIRRLLGLTEDKFHAVLAGKEEYNGKTGPDAIAQPLRDMNLDKEIIKAETEAAGSKKGLRDDALRKLKILRDTKRLKLHPSDWVLDRVPVLPPIFRPVSVMAGRGTQLVADPNYLYKELYDANDALKQLSGKVSDLSNERANVYNAFKGVTGLGDPITPKNQEKRVKGILQHVFGTSPKFGMMQRQLLSSTVDTVGRAVISPSGDLDMDQVGLPEEKVWDIYAPFLIRRLVQAGVPRVAAAQAVRDRKDNARVELLKEIEHRPVIITRAPVLHRYGMVALRPQLHKGSTMQLPPLITKGLCADNDGNCVISCSKICLDINWNALYSTVRNEDFSSWQEFQMRLTASGKVVCKNDNNVYEVAIGDLPKTGQPVKDKNGADVYTLPDGISVLTYDHKTSQLLFSPITSQLLFSPITSLTVQQDHTCAKVTTRRGRSITVSDNESLAAFDPISGDLVKIAPKDAVGKLVPVVAKQGAGGNDFDFDTGWWYASLVADGWISGDMIGYAKNDDAKRAKFVEIARKLFGDDFNVTEYRGYKGEHGKYADSVKIHLTGGYIARDARRFNIYAERTDNRRSAIYKKLPDELLNSGSEACLYGLLSGLFDGDACIMWSKSKAKPQFMSILYTSSPSLRDSILRLGRLLGLRFSVNAQPPRDTRSEAYMLIACLADLHALVSKIHTVDALATKLFSEFAAGPLPKDDTNLVPIGARDALAIANWLRRIDNAAYCAFRKAIKQHYLSRNLVLRAIALLTDAQLEQIPQVVAIAKNNTIHWDTYTEVIDAGKHEVFDIAVPDTKVFVSDYGLVVFDTLNFHVVVSEDARQEALDKMLPSRNLLSAAKFKVHQLPEQEYAGGLYAASSDRNDKKHIRTFATKEDAHKAYVRGELGVDDVVEIVRH